MIDFDGLSPEQRIVILQSRMLNAEDKITKHHKILIEGNGELPLVERIRNLEAFSASLRFWMRTVAVAIVLQTVTFGAAAIVYFVKLYPVLEQLLRKP